MPTPCSVCSRDDALDIDSEIARGASSRSIAKRFNLAETSLRRHLKSHVVPSVKAEIEIRRASRPADPKEAARSDRAAATVDIMFDLLEKAQGILKQAEATGKLTISLQALKEVRATLESVARLRGELNTQPTINVDARSQTAFFKDWTKDELIAFVHGPESEAISDNQD